MSIKTKILALSIISVLLTAIGLIALNVININGLSRENIETARQQIIDTKKTELIHYTHFAHTVIQNLLDSSASREEIIVRINALRFDNDGYFFVYSDGGIVTAHAQTNLIGKNLWDLKSKNGLLIIQELIAAAKRGGDYVTYDWPRLNNKDQFPKIGYAIWIPELKWVLGTGFYIEDIDAMIAETENTQYAHVTSMISSTLIGAGILVLILLVLGLVSANTIVKSSQHITGRLNRIINKDVDLTQRIEVNSNDQSGPLVSALNIIVAKIHTLLIKKAETACTVTESSNDAHINYPDAFVSPRSDLDKHFQVITDLKNNLGEIESVVDVIIDFAEKTNSLALNAAIEADLAGDAGKGFVVVADEFCTLASRTQDSTQEIQNIIEHLQKDLDEAVTLLSQKNERKQPIVNSAIISDSSVVSRAELNALLAEFKYKSPQ